MLATLILAAAASAGAEAAPPLSARPATVVLVRHAEKGDGTDPPLSPAGAARADALASAVAGLALDAVIVTDTKRTAQTGEPAARARGLTPVVVPTAGGAAAHVKGVVEAVRAVPGGAVLVVGHSNTIPLIVEALGGPELRALCEKEFATLFLLELPQDGRKPRLLRASYGAADPPGASDCSR